MGRPLKRRQSVSMNNNGTVSNSEKVALVNAYSGSAMVGDSSKSGEQLTFQARVLGNASAVSTHVQQKSSRYFRITNADGTETCKLTAAAAGAITGSASPFHDRTAQCMMEVKDTDNKTYYIDRIINRNKCRIGALGTGSPTQFIVGQVVNWVDDQTAATATDSAGTHLAGSEPGSVQMITA